MKNDVHLLQNIVQEDVSVDMIVEKFSNFITDRANVFFKKTSELKSENIFSYSNDTEKKIRRVFRKKQKVQEAVRDFNFNKSDENRKKRYSKPERITKFFAENASKISTVIDVNR